MAFTEAHRQIIERRWPKIWGELSRAPRPVAVSQTSDTRVPTLVVDGIHLTSSYDREAEASLQASAAPNDADHVWVYGVALGDIQRMLLARPLLKRLTVVILAPGAAFQSLSRFDHRDWLSDDRVELISGAGLDRVPAPFAVSPASLKLAAPETLEIRDLLVLTLAAPYQRRMHAALEQTLETRVRVNRPFIERDGDVATFFGSTEVQQAAVVAAGPTLEDWFPWIAERRDALMVIAVSTVIEPLQRHGISPDIVVVVDHRPGVQRHFTGVDMERLEDTTLVYSPVVDPEVLENWSGPRSTTYLANQSYAVPRDELPKGELFCSGTVTHAAVDLGVRLGVSELVLLGVDLCYPGEHTHVEGAAPRRERASRKVGSVWVLDGRGERAPTETNMLGYLRDLESYIGRHPEVRFLKGGRAGASIEGVRWLEEEME